MGGCSAPSVWWGSRPHGLGPCVGPSEHFKLSSVALCVSSHPCLGQAWFEVWGTWGESAPLGAVAGRMAPPGGTQCEKDPATVLGSVGDG